MEEPEFTDIIKNITAAAGRNVKFACCVKNLGTYKVRHNLYTLLLYFTNVHQYPSEYYSFLKLHVEVFI